MSYEGFADYADVVIVGAGPTGLMLAVDLSQQGVSSIVLEKRPEERSNLTRAFSLHARTLDLLHLRGLADPIRQRAVSVRSVPFLWGLDVSFSEVPAHHREMLVVPQFEVEGVLLEHARSRLIDIRYNSSYVGHVDGPQSVVVSYDRGSRTNTVSARYIVGADGARSATREQLDIQFPGKRVLAHAVIADAQITPKPEQPMLIAANNAGFVFIADFADGYHRVFGWNRTLTPNDSEHNDFAYLQATCQEVIGELSIADPRWVSRFNSYESVASSYRVGRGFVAGDAAHVHSPAGGLGMNLGLQDSVNLGWKLAQVLEYDVPDDFLDTYESEMRPLAESAVRSSGAMIHRATHRRGVRAHVEDVVMTLLQSVPLTRNIIQRKLGDDLSGSRLPLGSPRSTRTGQHHGAPTFAADLLRHPTALAALRAHKYLLEVPTGAEAWQPRDLGLPANIPVVSTDSSGGPARLVRPDGYVQRTIDG